MARLGVKEWEFSCRLQKSISGVFDRLSHRGVLACMGLGMRQKLCSALAGDHEENARGRWRTPGGPGPYSWSFYDFLSDRPGGSARVEHLPRPLELVSEILRIPHLIGDSTAVTIPSPPPLTAALTVPCLRGRPAISRLSAGRPRATRAKSSPLPWQALPPT